MRDVLVDLFELLEEAVYLAAYTAVVVAVIVGIAFVFVGF
jgi:fluoride ion exporter CrcB/FEX